MSMESNGCEKRPLPNIMEKEEPVPKKMRMENAPGEKISMENGNVEKEAALRRKGIAPIKAEYVDPDSEFSAANEKLDIS